ncbi:Uncharacterised protein [Listeria grayi]|uniref:hypothetical protein n=1 Tax=Listeria grayi TaxID=1641 RepID=UPI000F6EAA27|nr:hypothetical protein [Listeria grayi]VEI30656.1 Uncharacterised protein [Listeria grayi]
MEKRIWSGVILLVIVAMLTACGAKEATSPQKKENKEKTEQQEKKKKVKKDYVEIASNENIPLEKKRIKVNLPKAIKDPRAGKEEYKLFQNGVNEYNDTTQNVYKNSITILSYDSYYDVDNRELVILAVIINNRSKPISNIEFDGDMQITIDPKAKVVPNGFELSSENYDPIKPREGTIIPMTFRVLNYTKDVITFNKKEITGSLYNFKFKELDNKK